MMLGRIGKWLRRLAEKLRRWTGQDPGAEPAPETGNPQGTEGDAVDYGALVWSCGGFDGGRAALDVPRIRDLRVHNGGCRYRWEVGLESWGAAKTDYSKALACGFVQLADGSWRGGKFDWVSTSREARDFKNIHEGYRGWTLEGVPKRTCFALVMVAPDGRKRSNVVAADWRRE